MFGWGAAVRATVFLLVRGGMVWGRSVQHWVFGGRCCRWGLACLGMGVWKAEKLDFRRPVRTRWHASRTTF